MDHGEEETFSEKIKFGLLITFQIPSILCHLFIIYHLIRDRILRQSLHNHVILILLIINFFLITIDLSITLNFLHFGFIFENIFSICQTWNFLDSFLSNLSSFLMMWASIERHIFIFHDRQFLNTQFKRFIFHYFPLFIIIIYILIFYIVVIFFNPTCSNAMHYEYNEMFCGKACYVHIDIKLSLFELLIHKILSPVLIFFFSFTLLIRVMIKKLRRHQNIRWYQQRKMTIQFLSVSILYFIGTLPPGIGELLHILSNNPQDGHESEVQEDIFLYLFYFTALILPFICLMALPKIYSKLAILLHLKKPNEILGAPRNIRQNQIGNIIPNIQQPVIRY